MCRLIGLMLGMMLIGLIPVAWTNPEAAHRYLWKPDERPDCLGQRPLSTGSRLLGRRGPHRPSALPCNMGDRRWNPHARTHRQSASRLFLEYRSHNEAART